MKKFIKLCLVSMLYLTIPDYTLSQQPPYQVSMMLKMPGNFGNPIHLGNGVVIHEKLILTTADCVHFKFGENGKANRLDASEIIVYAGSSNGQNDILRMNVSSIKIAKNYEPTTQENDIALLTLSQSLPLETRSDIKWVMMDDNSHMNRSCLVNFYSRDTNDAISEYYQTEELYMVNNEICRNFTKYPAARKQDICSFYVLPHRFNCAKANSFLSFNNDRGTGLVCKSFLVGLLSAVVTRPNPANNCSDVLLRAIYTDIIPHLEWIYPEMSKMDTKYISTPYDASMDLNPLLANPSPSANIANAFIPQAFPNYPVSSYPFTNITMSNNATTNSTNVNSTLTNSTFVNRNSTQSNYATPMPLPINSTKWNSTSTGHQPARNHTGKPIILNQGSSTAIVPGYGGSVTDPHGKHPNPKPGTQTVFKNNGIPLQLSTGIVLVPLFFVQLRAIYL